MTAVKEKSGEGTLITGGVLIPLLKEVMAKRGLNAHQLAQNAGVPSSVIYRLLDGTRHDCNISTFERLAETLGVRFVVDENA